MAKFSQSHIIRERLNEERGTLHKVAPLRVAVAYPSPYHVGMSSLGFQTIYREMNDHEEVSCERFFLPDDVDAVRNAREPLLSYETQTPLHDFDVVAFSVAYELELGGLFDVLELSGIPAFREKRNETHPLVIAGGPLTFSNAEPLEPFVDAIVQGEADEVIHAVLDIISAAESRDAIIKRLSETYGVRVPHLATTKTRFFVAKASDEKLPARSAIVTKNTELSSMFLIEPERGCSRGCHYCVMRRTTNGGMRILNKEHVLSLIPEFAPKVGFVGAAVTDVPHIAELLESVVATGRQVSVSSLRADRLTLRLVKALKNGGSDSLTVASDGASQRLRDAVDRKHTETQIINAAQLAKAAGMRRLKVYNMVGLPKETDDDIDELVRFAVELSKILPVALGVAPFAAKRNTPMDGAPFAGLDVVESRLKRLRQGLKGRAELRPTSARWAYVEYMLAQSGSEAGLAAYQAHRNGGKFSDYKRAFEELNVRPFEARRTIDGRRNAVVWPSVGVQN